MTVILIVEDDILANEHLEFILQRAGYEVLSATSADEAAELLEDHPDVELLVTDVPPELEDDASAGARVCPVAAILLSR